MPDRTPVTLPGRITQTSGAVQSDDAVHEPASLLPTDASRFAPDPTHAFGVLWVLLPVAPLACDVSFALVAAVLSLLAPELWPVPPGIIRAEIRDLPGAGCHQHKQPHCLHDAHSTLHPLCLSARLPSVTESLRSPHRSPARTDCSATPHEIASPSPEPRHIGEAPRAPGWPAPPALRQAAVARSGSRGRREA